MTQDKDTTLKFTSVAGPDPRSIMLVPPGPCSIGRRSKCDLQLESYNTVSRDHAQLDFRLGPDGGQWTITDQGSKAGTWLNGTRIDPDHAVLLRHRDLVVIEPWTFQVLDPAFDGEQTEQLAPVTSSSPEDTSEDPRLTRMPDVRGTQMAKERLELLLDCASSIHGATNEQELAEAVVEAAINGTGFENAAMLRPLGQDDVVDVITCTGDLGKESAIFSRTLLRAASEGELVHFTQEWAEEHNPTESIRQLRIQEALCIPIKVGPAVVSCLYLDNRGKSARPFDRNDMEYCAGLGRITAMANASLARIDLEQRLAQERRELFLGTVRALVAAIDAKDTYTRGHSERVAWLGRELGRVAGLGEDALDRLHVSGLVHDVGKIGIPESILRKPDRLTDEEFDRIKEHPVTGCRILKDVPQLQAMMDGVRSHHERWDGKGYPDGLAGEEIPYFGRILAVADAFDAMSSARAYRGALDKEHALGEVRDNAGSQFDPELAMLFMKVDLADYERMLQKHVAQDQGE